MAFCRLVNFLYAALPLKILRGWLIRFYMERSPCFEARLLSREEARRLFVVPDEAGDAGYLWPSISSRAGQLAAVSKTRSSPAGRAWRWAAASAVAVLAVAGFWLLREVERPEPGMGSVQPTCRFEIEYVNVGGKPARTFIFQPRGTDTVFVWAESDL